MVKRSTSVRLPTAHVRKMLYSIGYILVPCVLVLVPSGTLAQEETSPGRSRFALERATLEEINAAFEAGTLTSERLLQLYLNRIQAYDEQGPRINAILNINPRALETARALDEERRSKGPRSVLHGIPIVVKDLFEIAGMPMTGGHPLLADFDPGRDAWIIRQLRDAGAIVLATVNLADAFGLHGVNQSTLGGVTLNPYGPDRYSTGGSSTGTGAAVAANFAPLGLGTDVGGSVVIPAAYNGVVGMLPSWGMVGRSGMIPGSPSLSRIGPFGRSVFDVAAMLSEIVGWDPMDATTLEAIGHFPRESYVHRLKDRPVGDFRFGVLRDLIAPDDSATEGYAIFERSIESLARAGATLVDPVSTGLNLLGMKRRESKTNDHEVWAAREAYFATWPSHAPFHSVAELVDRVGVENLKGAERLDIALPHESDDYLALRRRQQILQGALVGLMEDHDVDALVLPFRLAGPRELGSGLGTELTEALSSHAHLPSIVVPAGYTSVGAPIAVWFIGRPYSDLTLLQAAYRFEQVRPRWMAPPSVPPLPGELIPLATETH